MRTITDIINDVIDTEGGYVNDPDDSGGETMYGITKAVARKAGFEGDMKDLPRKTAFDIYYKQYVISPGFIAVHGVHAAIAIEVIDTGVNMGPVWGAKFLQRSLNALQGSGLVVDGIVGARTITALKDYVEYRKEPGVKVLLKMLNSLQCVRYIELVENASKNRKFIYGWVNARVNF